MAVNLNSNVVNSNMTMGVIPPAPSRKCPQMSFQGEKSDSFSGGEKKESFVHRHRGTIGFLVGMLGGEVLSRNLILPKIKNNTNTKTFFITMAVDCICGFAAQITAENMGRKSE